MPNLPFDDLPPAEMGVGDRQLQRQLESSTRIHFYESCDGVLQSLLLCCEWSITTAGMLTLVITCPDQATNWRILNNMVALGHQLVTLANQAKIRICPPVGDGTPFEIRVDELALYPDSL